MQTIKALKAFLAFYGFLVYWIVILPITIAIGFAYEGAGPSTTMVLLVILFFYGIGIVCPVLLLILGCIFSYRGRAEFGPGHVKEVKIGLILLGSTIFFSLGSIVPLLVLADANEAMWTLVVILLFAVIYLGMVGSRYFFVRPIIGRGTAFWTLVPLVDFFVMLYCLVKFRPEAVIEGRIAAPKEGK